MDTATKEQGWRELLADRVPEELAREIEIYETQLELKRQGKVEDKIFGETRLRRGVYGQRYDNGKRHDGVAERALDLPDGLTKGPETVWDAPGMQRIKIPFGGLTAGQMEELADLAEEYSDGILHVTTRQDFQFHYVHIEDTPDLMTRLGSVGITTREACGNSVRNVTACPLAGVCRDETFDVTPYSAACAEFLLGHPDVQDFGRKFKIAFSGCEQHACGLVNMHDLGFIARTRTENGTEQRGFEMYVGGGLGTIPHEAKLFDEFVPEDEILPLAQAISRVFARLGEKKNRARARVKFLIAKLGIEEFRRLVLEERQQLPADERWGGYVAEARGFSEAGLKPASPLNGTATGPAYETWSASNVYQQRQAGYVVATVTLPLGDLTSGQMRGLADMARRFCGDTVRTTVEQNMVFRWVSEADLPELFRALEEIGLAAPGAGTVVDITACPGTDTCKLGIASSRGLARQLSARLAAEADHTDEAVRGLRIKISGCFNSCGQHHIADLGFYGVSRKVGGTTVPHFQVVLGGKWHDNGGAYGLAVGAVPSKRVPDLVGRLTSQFLAEHAKGQSFQDWIAGMGKKGLKALLSEFTEVPAYEQDSTLYSDWGDPREFTISDLGTGECAGEVVSQAEFDLQAAEREHFEAQIALEEEEFQRADDTAYGAMLEAARGLIRMQEPDLDREPNTIIAEFQTRFVDTELFFDKYAGSKFANYLLHRHADHARTYDREQAFQLIEETALFIEAAHACHGRMLEQAAATPAPPA
ncbi:MAG: nitrite/sulfite reductase [Deltaproteobacteria bacterium]